MVPAAGRGTAGSPPVRRGRRLVAEFPPAPSPLAGRRPGQAATRGVRGDGLPFPRPPRTISPVIPGGWGSGCWTGWRRSLAHLAGPLACRAPPAAGGPGLARRRRAAAEGHRPDRAGNPGRMAQPRRRPGAADRLRRDPPGPGLAAGLGNAGASGRRHGPRPGSCRLRRAGQEPAGPASVSVSSTRRAMLQVAVIMAVKGGMAGDITVGDCLELLEARARARATAITGERTSTSCCTRRASSRRAPRPGRGCSTRASTAS